MGEYLGWRNRARFLRIRYEDFVRQPQQVLETIGQFVGADATAALSGPREVTPVPNHSISGNPSKFDKGGNYNLGITDQSIFPELTFEETQIVHGLQVTIAIEQGSPAASRALLEKFGLPFEKEGK